MTDVKFSFDTIIEEHRELIRMVEELKGFLKLPRPDPGEHEAITWASGLGEKLLKLHDSLCAHFRVEEESGALDELERRHPHAVKEIQALQEEHEQILHDLRAIMGAAMVYAEGKTPESPQLRRWTLTAIDQLVRHERRESDLISRSVATTNFEEALGDELEKYRLDSEFPEICVDALNIPLRAVGWTEAQTIPVGSTVDQVTRCIQQGGTSCMVVTRGETLAGLVTERDLITRVMGKGLDPKETRVEDIMTSGVFGLRPDEPLTHALALMDVGGYRHVVVVEGGQLCGVVTARGILHYINKLVPEELRVLTGEQHPQERFGG
ncbi:MAG: CBS domain-containing protein [Candidatus Latescibacterota bacterium]|nr:MAG: CBS domain-containing protein [Candidatus Latescibacterota bacterium]